MARALLRLVGPAGDPSSRIFPTSVVFSPCQPSTVRRFVIPHRVNAVDLIITNRRTFTHIFKERLEVGPTLTYRDSNRSIVLIRCVASILATRVHRRPRSVCRGSGPSVLEGRCTLARIRSEFLSRLGSMMLALHRMIAARIVSRNILTCSIPAFINGRQFPAPTGARLRYQLFPHANMVSGLGWRCTAGLVSA